MQWWCAAQGVPWTWQWQAYPGVWIFVLGLAAGYRGLRKRYPESDRPRFRAWMAGLGILALWVALDWPVGALGAGYLASLHMVQYLLIALVAPPLLLMGLPRGVYAALGRGPLLPVLRVVSHPIAAVLVFVSLMAWTHWPPVVDTLMVTQLGSFFLDLVWLVSGVVFWWPVVAPVPERSWLQEPAKVGYLIVATLVNTGVFAYLTFSPLPLYATYELAPPVTGLTTREDQLLAGLLMKMGGAVILWTAITIIFFRWVRRSESDTPGKGAVAAVLLALLVACGGETDQAGDAVPVDPAVEASVEVAWLPAGPLEVAAPVVGEPALPERAAAYLHLRNPGSAALRVVEVTAEGVQRVELHETSMEDGLMRMRPVDGVEIPPGEVVTLRPGGLHLMLMGVTRELSAGDELPLVLHLEGGGRVPVTARVVPLDRVEAVLEAVTGG